jgi:redox-sensitive bicupin YhaK (pirin superfamily)
MPFSRILASVFISIFAIAATTFDYCNMKSTFKKIPNSYLGVSEPNPSWFGNPGNPIGDKNWTNKNWLKSRFHFSFAEYSNQRNQQFGVLRVMNDDLVQPNRGFGSHPHRDVEICTYVVEGSLTHQDSTGTKETLQRGAIQFMTAGKGVVHSEHNLDATKPLRFIQMWITTRTRGLAPNYGSHTSPPDARAGRWAHLVTDVKSSHSHSQPEGEGGEDVPIKINQDANISVSEIAAGRALPLRVRGGRQAYLLCVEGSAKVLVEGKEYSLERHDAAEVVGSAGSSGLTGPSGPTGLTGPSGDPGAVLDITAGAEGAHLLVVEMAYDASGGRTDL